ncbi:hypothetical protein QZH41_005720 [Actinostola sp. cb2023]|nr:hypothetical protein QZH41_005720 [Actinostola sp. cb2023]
MGYDEDEDFISRGLITGGRDGRLRIWNYNNGHCLRTLEKENEIDEVTDLVYIVMHKNRYIISVGWDRRINVFSDDIDDIHHIQRPYIDWSDDLIIIWNRISGHIFCHIHSPHRRKGTEDDLSTLDGGNAIEKLVFLPKRASAKESITVVTRDSATLVASGPQGYVHFWNVYSGGVLCATFRPADTSHMRSPPVCEHLPYGQLPYADTSRKRTPSVCGHNFRRRTPPICGHLPYANTSRMDNSRMRTPPVSGHLPYAGTTSVGGHLPYAVTSRMRTPPVWTTPVCGHIPIEIAEVYGVLLTSSVDCTVRAWTWEGHFIGTFGQPLSWDINEPISYQHPMAPYDVLVDPQTLSYIPDKIISRPSTQDRGRDENGNDKDDEEKVCRVWDIETGCHEFEFNQLHGDSAITCMTFDSTERRQLFLSLGFPWGSCVEERGEDWGEEKTDDEGGGS